MKDNVKALLQTRMAPCHVAPYISIPAIFRTTITSLFFLITRNTFLSEFLQGHLWIMRVVSFFILILLPLTSTARSSRTRLNWKCNHEHTCLVTRQTCTRRVQCDVCCRLFVDTRYWIKEIPFLLNMKDRASISTCSRNAVSLGPPALPFEVFWVPRCKREKPASWAQSAQRMMRGKWWLF